jgi:restriction endonuclease S subunit
MQCFVVWNDEIGGRLDAVYYKPEFAVIKADLEKARYPIKQIHDFAKVICGPFGSSIQVKDYQETGTPLVRIANIDNDQQFINENIVFINESLTRKLQSYKVKKDDLVISQRGTLGLTAIIPDFFDGAIISANFIAIKELRGVSPKFLGAFLNSTYGKIQLKQKTSGQVQTKITTDDIKTLLVPL